MLFVGGWTFQNARNQKIDATLQQATSAISRRLPVVIEHHTRLDQVSVEPGRVILYKATLIDVLRNQPQLPGRAQALKPKLVEVYRASDAMKPLRDARVTIKFRYYDWWGKYLTEIVIAPSDL